MGNHCINRDPHKHDSDGFRNVEDGYLEGDDEGEFDIAYRTLAAKRREYSERLRQQATTGLRENIRRAHAEGVSIARIAREAHLSRQGVYDLLAAAPPS